MFIKLIDTYGQSINSSLSLSKLNSFCSLDGDNIESKLKGEGGFLQADDRQRNRAARG